MNLDLMMFMQKIPCLIASLSLISKNLPNTVKYGINVINLDELKSIRPHWIAFYENGDNVTYFDSFAV